MNIAENNGNSDKASIFLVLTFFFDNERLKNRTSRGKRS